MTKAEQTLMKAFDKERKLVEAWLDKGVNNGYRG